jgi:hypothetical protein
MLSSGLSSAPSFNTRDGAKPFSGAACGCMPKKYFRRKHCSQCHICQLVNMLGVNSSDVPSSGGDLEGLWHYWEEADGDKPTSVGDRPPFA